MLSDHDHEIKVINIKKNVSLNDFMGVYKIFTYAPYNEKWSDDEIKKVYYTMQNEGKVFGIYDNLDCVGIITLTDKNQPLNFTKKALYIADLAVLSRYRKYNISDKLLDFAIEYAKENMYEIIYLRTLEKGNSLDYDSFKNKKFKKINDKCQVVKMERTRVCKDEDCRIFMKYDIV